MRSGDEGAIVDAVLDYFEGWYDGDAARMERALHPELAKRGFVDGATRPATAAEMVAATAEGQGKRDDPAERKLEVDVLTVYDDIASVAVRSVPYIEYLHLVRMDDRWRILNTLWRRP